MGELFLALPVLLLVVVVAIIGVGCAMCRHPEVRWRGFWDSKAGYDSGVLYICTKCSEEFASAPKGSLVV